MDIGTSHLPPELFTPGAIVVPGVPVPPTGLSTYRISISGFSSIWPFDPMPGWTGEPAFSARFMINPEYLQNPGDTISVCLLRFRGYGPIMENTMRTVLTIERGGGSPTLNTPCQFTNLARDYRGSVMTASSEGPHRRAIITNNGIRFGSTADSWIAADAGPQWLMVDFGELKNFNTVRIYQAGTRIRDYSFEYFDGVNWNPFHTGDHMLIQSLNHYEVRVECTMQARFVRLYSARSNQPGTPIAVFEFEVYYLPDYSGSLYYPNAAV